MLHWILMKLGQMFQNMFFLYFDIGVYAWKILVFELNPFKQWRTIKIPKILIFKVSYE